MQSIPLTSPPTVEHEVSISGNGKTLTVWALAENRGKAVTQAISAFRSRHPEVPKNVQLAIAAKTGVEVSQ